MRVLCLNTGSSTLKWSVLEMPAETRATGGENPLDAPAQGAVDLSEVVVNATQVDAVAHRLVHGGGHFWRATRIDDEVVAALEKLQALDPVHLPRALAGLAAARGAFPGCPHIACFDTTFHATLPAAAYTYAVPQRWTNDWGLRRYGFHGLSVAHAVRRARAMLGVLPERLLVCHLGSGSSITAVRAGRSVDTTMGFTPLEGVPMATRSGSVDPGLVLHVMRSHGLGSREVEVALEEQSGLLGLGGNGDLREILRKAEEGNPRAELSYAVWLTGMRRGFGAMLSALDGLEAVVFTGGIGEHQPRIRSDLLSPFAWCGIVVDAGRNTTAPTDGVVSADRSRIAILRVTAREDLTMAQETFELLSREGKP